LPSRQLSGFSPWAGNCRRKSCETDVRLKLHYDSVKALHSARSNGDESLVALRTDCIGLYEPHDVSSGVRYERLMRKDRGLKALREAKELGKIKHIGFTSHKGDLIKRMIRSEHFESALITGNRANCDAEEEVLEPADELDVGLLVMKVFGNASILELNPPEENRRPTVEERLRFAFSNRGLPLLLTEVKSPEGIEQNVSIAEDYKRLYEKEAHDLREFGDRLGQGYFYGCAYCFPCPQDIDIPGILQQLDYQERITWELPLGRKEYAKSRAIIEDSIDSGH